VLVTVRVVISDAGVEVGGGARDGASTVTRRLAKVTPFIFPLP
jgi:hypothetical protein